MATTTSTKPTSAASHPPVTIKTHTSKTNGHFVLDNKTINPNVLNAQYAVRGELAIRAEELRIMLKDGKAKDLGFEKVVHANIGNPQQLDQLPLTFFRQVVALCEYPDLIAEKNMHLAKQLFPTDVIARAREILDNVGSVGAYSQSQGVPIVRDHVAQYITQRDGHKADPNNIFCVAGASAGVHLLFQLMLSSPDVGVMIPIPQYPLYTAALALYNGAPVPYYLDEEGGWSTSLKGMEEAYIKARKEGKQPEALVIINPGNPTGGSLPAKDIKSVLEFCQKYSLICIADEVYQTNIFPDSPPFTSFRKVMYDNEDLAGIPLASLHSTSKGVIGECGQRGGYVELLNFTKDAREQIYKLASINLCAPVSGQILLDCLVHPPVKGEPSYEVYKRETGLIYDTLYERATKLHATFERMEGVHCQKPQGAMYLFPRITLPDRAVAEAKKLEKTPDAFYCRELLEKTGICVVPGDGFGQKEGTVHFRTTFLAPGDFGDKMEKFHKEFMKTWA